MDSRIEELAGIIAERANEACGVVQRAADGVRGDRYWAWSQMRASALEILSVIDKYRRDHPEEYVDDEAKRLRGMCQTYKDELVKVRQELAHYKEREKTMGWDQGITSHTTR